VTEQLLTQQLESPSPTGRVEPRSETSLSDADTNERDANRHTHSHWQICVCLGRASVVVAAVLAVPRFASLLEREASDHECGQRISPPPADGGVEQ
jgi:hypothetical protein